MEEEGLTTQQWAVLGALSRPKAEGGMSVGDLARYYEQALEGFTVNDTAHTLHYLLKILDNMKRLDELAGSADVADAEARTRSARR